jgi:hypothetical protein
MEKSHGSGLWSRGPRAAVVHGGPTVKDGRGAHRGPRCTVLRCTKPHHERGEMERAAARSSPRASPMVGQRG